MFFKKKKYEIYGEGGLYEGVQQAATSKVYGRKGCRIHISQDKQQKVIIEIMNNDRVVKKMCVEGDKWIKVNGKGEYWIKAYNDEQKALRAGMSIRSLE